MTDKDTTKEASASEKSYKNPEINELLASEANLRFIGEFLLHSQVPGHDAQKFASSIEFLHNMHKQVVVRLNTLVAEENATDKEAGEEGA